MITPKRRRRTSVSAEACRRIIEWKRLSDLCRELGVSKKTAEKLRTKYRQVFQ